MLLRKEAVKKVPEEKQDKKSPLATRKRRRMDFEDEKSKFRAISEEVDGQKIRRLRGYPILFDTPGRPYRGSPWIEKIDKKALEGVDFSRLVLLLDHETTWALGRVGKNMTATVDDTGLFIDVTLRDTWLDDYVFDRVQSEIIDGMSFWFDSKSLIASDWTNKIDVVLKINEVYEVSILVFPAYEETVIITDQAEENGQEDNEAIKTALVNLIEEL